MIHFRFKYKSWIGGCDNCRTSTRYLISIGNLHLIQCKCTIGLRLHNKEQDSIIKARRSHDSNYNRETYGL